MFGVGWTEILLILVVALLVLGPGKLPDIAKGLGKGIREFKKAMNSLDQDEQPAARKPAQYTELPKAEQTPAVAPPPGPPQYVVMNASGGAPPANVPPASPPAPPVSAHPPEPPKEGT